MQTGLATRDGLIEPREKAKNLERGSSDLPVFIHRNPLTSLETAKGIFGNPWRKEPEIWKCLEKSLEVGGGRAETNYPVQSGLTPTAAGP